MVTNPEIGRRIKYYSDRKRTESMISISLGEKGYGKTAVMYTLKELSKYRGKDEFDRARIKWILENHSTSHPFDESYVTKRKNAEKRKKYLAQHRHIFKRDNWTCTCCGLKIKSQISARAYNPLRKLHDEVIVDITSQFLVAFTLCPKCYNKAIRNTSCARYKTSEGKSCDELMVVPTLREILDNNLGKGHERWLHVDV